MTTCDELVEIAASLASEHGENPEYDRALAELIAEAFPVMGMTLGERAEEVLADIIRTKQET